MTGGTMKKSKSGAKAKQSKSKKQKYNNRKTIVDGITFASKAEAIYYQELKLRKRAGDIQDFSLQPEFQLLPAFKKHGKKYQPMKYTADFKILHNDGSTEIIEVKGVRTRDYMLRMKLFNYRYPDLKFTEVKAW